MSEEIHWKQDK